MMKQIEYFFIHPTFRKHIFYEALRRSFIDKVSDKEICDFYNIKYNTFRSIKQQFSNAIKKGENPALKFFNDSKVGKREKLEPVLVRKIISLRMRNLSIPDIKAILATEEIKISFWKIEKIIKLNNFPPLFRRTQNEKDQILIPDSFKCKESFKLEFPINDIYTSINGSIFLFYPTLKLINIEKIIAKAGYPESSQISQLNSILSYLALKLIKTKRFYHSNDYGHDRGLGLFAGLNVLPKNAWFASYSSRVSRKANVRFLKALHKEVDKINESSGDLNLDFTTIPYWGDKAVLEKNWSGTRHLNLKSVLALLVQDQNSRLLKYSNAEIKHSNKSAAILEFIDFYKSAGGKINCLVFDSKFTTYKNLDKLNSDNIKFLTLRRRSKKMIKSLEKVDKGKWVKIKLNKKYRRKHRNLIVLDTLITLSDYKKKLRQIVITNNGRDEPAFLITNDMAIGLEEAIIKYAKRWLIEQEISEQIEFYHLNRLNSSIVVKVDFDLTMSILADTIYKLFSVQIPGFANKKSDIIYRSFIKNYTEFKIDSENKTIQIILNKKVNLPLLFETDWFDGETNIPWLDNYKLKFEIGTSL